MEDYAVRAAHYRNKAEEAQTVAAEMSSAEARATLLVIAADYIHMAETLERLVAEHKSGKG